MSRSTYISAGSNTTVYAAPGVLYGIDVSPVNGTSVVVVDSLNLGTTPNLNSDSLTGLLLRRRTYASAVPDFIDTKGVHFDNGLTVAATSSAGMTVYWSE